MIVAAGPDSFLWWEWVVDHRDDVWTATVEHVRLTAVAVGVGFAIAMVMALLALRHRSLYAPLASVSGVLYSIPSLALFGILVPITGLGFLTAEIALVSYTLLILLRNIVAGVDAVPAHVREAADAMGYRRWHRVLSVDLRLATPAIVTGVRIATVTIIGLTTVAALVHDGGYGEFIEDGLSRSFSTPIVLGGGLSVLLAVVADTLLVGLQWLITPWLRREAR